MQALNFIESTQNRLDHFIDSYLKTYFTEDSPLEAPIRYALLKGGKRLRPLLVYAVGKLEDVPLEKLDALAGAIEMIHAYSLVHDDLPILDNDQWRRGEPTCHKQFGSALALLTGDALQSMAFELLSLASLAPILHIQCISILANAIGPLGMAGGQAMEFASPEIPTFERLQKIHFLKTAALLEASLKMAALVSGLSSSIGDKLGEFGRLIGHAYQIQDDIRDQGNGNFCYVRKVGLNQSKITLDKLLSAANLLIKDLELYKNGSLEEVFLYMFQLAPSSKET